MAPLRSDSVPSATSELLERNSGTEIEEDTILHAMSEYIDIHQ